jgi:hypothetical protein
MNITMRILTEENIGQIENLTFSKNIDKLTKTSVRNLRDIQFDINQLLRTKKQEKAKQQQLSPERIDIKNFNPQTPEGPPPQGPAPGFDENGSPEYAQGSPPIISPSQFYPESPEGPPPGFDVNGSPEYAQGSPAPAQLTTTGGELYRINDIVQIRGGSNKKWRIKEKGRFITLENLSPTNDEDTIKIVEPDQIYHATYIDPRLKVPTEYDMLQPQNPYNSNIQSVGTMQPNMYGIPPGGIQINPTFVVGDNNTTSGNEPMGSNDGSPFENNIREPSKTIGGGELNKKIQFKESDMDMEKIAEKEPEKSGDVTSNSFFDFLKVRKVM